MLLSDRLISDNKNLYKSVNNSKQPVFYDEEECEGDDVEVDDDGDVSEQDGDDEDEKLAHNEKSATTNSYSVDVSLKSHSNNKSLSSSISSTSTSSYSSSISTHNNLNSNLYEFKSDTFDKNQKQQQQQQSSLIKPIAYLPKENPSYFSSLKPSPENKNTTNLNKNLCSSLNDNINSKADRNNVTSQQASKLIDRLISTTEDNSNSKQSGSLSYTCQAFNSSRLSSYDNHDFKEALANIQSLNPNSCNNSTIEKMSDNHGRNQNTNEQNSKLNDAGNKTSTLQATLMGKYGRKRASIAFPSISNQVNTIKHGSSSALFSLSNKSSSSNNIFARALNYAKKSSSSSSSSSSASTNNHNKSTWKNKLSKYLSNSSSKSNGLNKRADSQEGCDIIIDEDMFSSYHLSRRHPSSVLNVSTVTSHAINNTNNNQNNNNNNSTFNGSTNLKSTSIQTNDEINTAFKIRKKIDEEKKKTKSKSLIADMIDIPKKPQNLQKQDQPTGFFSTNNFANKSIINNGFNSLRKILKFGTNSNAHNSKNYAKQNKKQFASTSVLTVPDSVSSTDLSNKKISKVNVKRESLTLDELQSAQTSKSSTNSSMSTSLSIPNEAICKQRQSQQISQNLATVGKESTSFSSPSTSSASTCSSKTHSTPNNENLFQALSCIDAAIDASINKLSVKNNSNSKLFDSCKPIKSINIFNHKKDSSESNANHIVPNNSNKNKLNSLDENLNKSNSKTFCFKKNLLLNNQFSCIKNDNPTNYLNNNLTQSTSTLSASYVKPKPSLIDNTSKSKISDNLNSASSSSTCAKKSTNSKSYETNEKFPFNKTELTSDVNKTKPMTDDDLLCDLEVASFFDRYNSAIHYEDSNYVENYDEDLQTFDAFQHSNDTNTNADFDSNLNSAYLVHNKPQTKKKNLMTDDDELENLDFLVRQLAVEANLTDLANSNVFGNGAVPLQKYQQTSKIKTKCNNYDNANLNTYISDLDVEHLVDDLNKQLTEYSHKDADSFSDEDNQDDDDELDDEDEDDLETDNDSIDFDKIIEIFDKNAKSNATDYSSTTKNTRSNNSNGKKFDSSSLMRRPVEYAQSRKELKSMIDETSKNQSRHKRSLSTVSNNSITVNPNFSGKFQFNNYPIKPKENNKPNKFNSSLTIYPQTSSKLNNSNNASNTLKQAEKHIVFNKIQPLTDFNFNNIKIEKKIKLNYRKPQNLNSLLNFGTLC